MVCYQYWRTHAVLSYSRAVWRTSSTVVVQDTQVPIYAKKHMYITHCNQYCRTHTQYGVLPVLSS
eukprot:3797747-Rhodomonas_salina.1